jgi:hypothetical protein
MVVRTKKNKKKDKDAGQTAKEETGDAEHEEHKAESDGEPEPSKQVKAQPKQSKQEVQQPEEEEDVVDDWEIADVDEVVSKIASKPIVPATATGKAIHVDEEDDDLDTSVSTKASKST